jgi:hypothetical protein
LKAYHSLIDAPFGANSPCLSIGVPVCFAVYLVSIVASLSTRISAMSARSPIHNQNVLDAASSGAVTANQEDSVRINQENSQKRVLNSQFYSRSISADLENASDAI